MQYLKYTPYVYLFAAIICALQVIETWEAEKDKAYLFMGFTAVSVFMFFFRRNFAKKIADRNRKP